MPPAACAGEVAALSGGAATVVLLAPGRRGLEGNRGPPGGRAPVGAPGRRGPIKRGPVRLPLGMVIAGVLARGVSPEAAGGVFGRPGAGLLSLPAGVSELVVVVVAVVGVLVEQVNSTLI